MSVMTEEVSRGEEAFARRREELQAAADATDVTLPEPTTYRSPVRSHYGSVLHHAIKFAWEKDDTRFGYLTDGLWTFEDILRTNPEETVKLGLDTPFDRSEDVQTFYEQLASRYEEDEEVNIYPHLPLPLVPDIGLELPAGSVEEKVEALLDEPVVMPRNDREYTIENARFIGTPDSEKLKKTEFVNALLDPWRKEQGDGIVPDSLSYKQLFGNADAVDIETEDPSVQEYTEFLYDLKDGKIGPSDLYNNLASHV